MSAFIYLNFLLTIFSFNMVFGVCNLIPVHESRILPREGDYIREMDIIQLFRILSWVKWLKNHWAVFLWGKRTMFLCSAFTSSWISVSFFLHGSVNLGWDTYQYDRHWWPFPFLLAFQHQYPLGSLGKFTIMSVFGGIPHQRWRVSHLLFSQSMASGMAIFPWARLTLALYVKRVIPRHSSILEVI